MVLELPHGSFNMDNYNKVGKLSLGLSLLTWSLSKQLNI
jgi:hypothetical protein